MSKKINYPQPTALTQLNLKRKRKLNKLISLPVPKPSKINILSPKIDFKLINYLTTTKFGIKSTEMIKTLPSQLIVQLETIVYVFDEKNSLNKNFKVSEVFAANMKTTEKLGLPPTNMSDF